MFVRYWLMKLARNLQRSNVGACVYCGPKLERGVFASGLGTLPPASALWPPCWRQNGAHLTQTEQKGQSVRRETGGKTEKSKAPWARFKGQSKAMWWF